MASFRKAIYTDASCYDQSIERTRVCFDRFDRVSVSFSGGKDSTAVLQIALEVAREKGRLPLRVIHFDEEAIAPETEAYIRRVAQNPEVAFEWFCLPVEHRNACSSKEPTWYPWDPDKKHLWVRDLPPEAITDFPGWGRKSIPEGAYLMEDPARGTSCMLMGIRADESMTRRRAICTKSGDMAFIQASADAKHIFKGYPIYDWRTADVWRAPHVMGWDFNRAYEIMHRYGFTLHQQRVAPPFGEQPAASLHMWKRCWPDLWAKMVNRVPGAATAARYFNSELYRGGQLKEIPDGYLTWREYCMAAAAVNAEVASGVKSCVSAHRTRTRAQLPDDEPHPTSGYCWKGIAIIAKAGGDKLGRQSQRANQAALVFRQKNNVKSEARAQDE